MKVRRVLVLNNYPMDRVLREMQLGETPDHVLFGINRLPDFEFELVFLPYPARGPWYFLQILLRIIRLPLDLGDLQQQVLALKLSHDADLVFAPCGSQTHLLQYLRALGIFQLPIITLIHHPFLKGRLDFLRVWQRKLYLQGADLLPTLSHATARELRSEGAPESKIIPLTWGTDVEFYGPWVPPGQGIIATGRTGRDFKTFALAAIHSRIKSTIIGLQGQLDDPIFHSSPHLKIIEARNEQPAPGEKKGWLKYPELCAYMRHHAAIAIPLFQQGTLVGLTSLMDALGLGRAVLLTRNHYIDIDIEAEGIGFWIDSGDVNGWVRSMKWVHEHPDEVCSMGRRARYLAETKYNSRFFSASIAHLFCKVSPPQPVQ